MEAWTDPSSSRIDEIVELDIRDVGLGCLLLVELRAVEDPGVLSAPPPPLAIEEQSR
jgi:hypothetical protein